MLPRGEEGRTDDGLGDHRRSSDQRKDGHRTAKLCSATCMRSHGQGATDSTQVGIVDMPVHHHRDRAAQQLQFRREVAHTGYGCGADGHFIGSFSLVAAKFRVYPRLCYRPAALPMTAGVCGLYMGGIWGVPVRRAWRVSCLARALTAMPTSQVSPMNRSSAPRYCRCGARLGRDHSGSLCSACEKQLVALRVEAPEVPADFWETEQLRDAFATQHIGRVSRAYRKHPHHMTVYGRDGIPQAVVGDWLGLTQAQISRIENGSPVRHLDNLTHWAQSFAYSQLFVVVQTP